MALTFTVGGTKGTFEDLDAQEVAGVLDNAFGAEGDWEGTDPCQFGGLASAGWADLQRRGVEELGRYEVPNLLAIDAKGRGVFLPASVQAMSLPLSHGHMLKCASLHGLRRELATLAEHWDLPVEDAALLELVDVDCDPDDGFVADAPEIIAYARLALAANEAARRGCPLWIVG